MPTHFPHLCSAHSRFCHMHLPCHLCSVLAAEKICSVSTVRVGFLSHPASRLSLAIICLRLVCLKVDCLELMARLVIAEQKIALKVYWHLGEKELKYA